MTPKDIQANTNALKSQTAAFQGVGAASKVTEMQLQKYLGTIARANKINATLASAMNTLKERGNEAAESIAKFRKSSIDNSAAISLNAKKVRSLTKKIYDQEKAIVLGLKNGKITAGQAKKLRKDIKAEVRDRMDAIQTLRDLTTANKENSKAMQELGATYDTVSSALEKFNSREYIERGVEFNDVMQKRIEALQEFCKIQVKAGKYTQEQADEEMKEFSSWESRESQRQKLMQYTTDLEKDQLDAYEDMAKLKDMQAKHGVGGGKVIQDMRGAAQGVRGGVKGVMGAKGFGGAYEAGKGLSASIGKFKAMREAMAGSAKGASGLVGTLGALAKAFGLIGKLNPMAAVISGVVGVVQILNDMNKFIVKYNQSFVKMQGSTVLIKDVSKSIKTFTDSVFDMNRNMKYGLKSEDILGVFEAMSQGGLSLGGVGQRVSGGYNAVIDEAVKISRNFGVTMEEAGTMIAGQMVELRMSLKDVDDAFKTISYDAAISGIKSERFYDSVSAATMALGMYGNYLGNASALLREFYKTGALGYKDASQQAEDMMGMFKGMSDSQRMSMIAMTGGGAKWKGVFDKKATEIQGEVTKQEELVAALKEQARLATGPRKDDLTTKVKAEEDTLKKQRSNLIMLKKAADGGETAMATALAYMSEKGPGVVLDVLRSIGTDIYDPKQWITIKNFLMNTLKMTQDGAERFIATMQSGEEGMAQAAKDYANAVSKVPEEKRKQISDLIDKSIVNNKLDVDALKKKLVDQGLVSSDAINDFGLMVAENARLMAEVLRNGMPSATESKKLYEKGVTDPIQTSLNVDTESSAKRMDELIRATTSFEDYIGIGKENLEYTRAMLAGGKVQEMAAIAGQATARFTGEILGWVQDIATGKKGRKTDKEFKETDDYTTLVALTEKSLQIQKDMSNPKMTEEERALSQKQVDALEKLRGDYAEGHENLLVDATAGAHSKMLRRQKYEATLADVGAKPEDRAAAEKEQNLFKKFDVFSERKVAEAQAKEAARVAKENKKGGSPAKGTAPGIHEDFEAKKGGWLKARKGDTLIFDKDKALGKSGYAGQFKEQLPNTSSIDDLIRNTTSKMDYSRGSQPTSVTVPLTVSIGSVNGDADDLLRRIGPAIEQTFTRMYLDKQKRGN